MNRKVSKKEAYDLLDKYVKLAHQAVGKGTRPNFYGFEIRSGKVAIDEAIQAYVDGNFYKVAEIVDREVAELDRCQRLYCASLWKFIDPKIREIEGSEHPNLIGMVNNRAHSFLEVANRIVNDLTLEIDQASGLFWHLYNGIEEARAEITRRRAQREAEQVARRDRTLEIAEFEKMLEGVFCTATT